MCGSGCCVVGVPWIEAYHAARNWLNVSEFSINSSVRSNLAMSFSSPQKQQVAGTKSRNGLPHYLTDSVINGKQVSLYKHVNTITVEKAFLMF